MTFMGGAFYVDGNEAFFSVGEGETGLENHIFRRPIFMISASRLFFPQAALLRMRER